MSGAIDLVKSLLFPARERHAIPTLDGAYVPNDRLEEFAALGPDLIRPDDIAAGENGAIYVDSERHLIRLSGEGLHERTTVASFEAPITALTRLSDATFAVGLDGVGVARLSADGTILSTIDRLDGTPVPCVTAIVEDPVRGGLYFTVGSTRHGAENWVWDLMERNRSGVLAYWPAGTDTAQILLSELPYPNGLQIEDGGAALLFTQAWTHSLARYRLTGNQRGRVETLIDNMAGYPARIAPARGGGHWLAIFAMRTQLIELVLRESEFRQEMMRCVEPELWIRPALKTTGSYLEPLQGGGIKKLGIRKPWAPPRSYGLVVRLDAHYEPMFSLHSRVDGRNHGITAAREVGDRLFVVAKGNNRLLVEDLRALEVDNG